MTAYLNVLGIPVTEEQLDRWLGYYCPGRQPFRVVALPRTTRAQLVEERRRQVRPKPIPAWPSDPLLCASLVRWV